MHKHLFLPPRGMREITVAKLIFSLLLVLLQPEGLLRQRMRQREARWYWMREKGCRGMLMWPCLPLPACERKAVTVTAFLSTLCESEYTTALGVTIYKCIKDRLACTLQGICDLGYSGCSFLLENSKQSLDT